MRRSPLFLFFLFLFPSGIISAQDYFLIKKNGSDRTRKIWLDRLKYTVLTADTQFANERILSYNDTAIGFFRYRMEGDIGVPDSVSIALSEVSQLRKRLVAKQQIYASSWWVLILGMAGTLVTAPDDAEAALVFVPVMAVSAGILIVGYHERHFDMKRDWSFERGVYAKRRRRR